VLTVSENGYGKRTEMSEFPTKGRGTKGVIAMQTSERNGTLVGAVQVFDGDQLMLISNQGTLVRTRADEISVLGRNTQGVRVIRTKTDESLVSVERIEEPEDDDELAAEALSEGVDETAAPAATEDDQGEQASPQEPEEPEEDA
jgi:DNA gyrase subunit A